MTVSRGQAWGTTGPAPAATVGGLDDGGARAVAERARRALEPVPPLRLSAGDLLRTVGGPREPTAEAALLPADLASVLLDGRQHWFVAHLVARRHWWRGRIVAVMNAQFLGAWDVAPRGHPNDGRLDVVDVAASMTLRDRWRARGRLPTGTHLPHPDIAVQQVTAWQTMLPPGTRVWLDGRAMGEVRILSVRVEPDALLLVL